MGENMFLNISKCYLNILFVSQSGTTPERRPQGFERPISGRERGVVLGGGGRLGVVTFCALGGYGRAPGLWPGAADGG